MITSGIEYAVDPRFEDHFRNVHQVFMYINDQCNLGCEQCIYKPHVTYNEDREISLPKAIGLLDSMRELGAWKLTFLGGEPTLYGRNSDNDLGELIGYARETYRYLRMDTNGLFNPSLYATAGLDRLDELAFSLDGFDSATNDKLRGGGTFPKIVKQIRTAVARGINCSITCCLQRDLLERDEDGMTGVEKVIRLGEQLGVSTVNFHDLFKAGVPMDTWTGSFNTTVEAHVAMYDEIKALIDGRAFGVAVRLPQAFVTKEEFMRDPFYYGFCPVKAGERVMIHSDGVIRICSNLICSSFGTGTFTDAEIRWNDTDSNELLHHKMNEYTPCTNRSKNKSYGDYVPLCFSFKPDQNEPSWQEQGWDTRRGISATNVPTSAEVPMSVG